MCTPAIIGAGGGSRAIQAAPPALHYDWILASCRAVEEAVIGCCRARQKLHRVCIRPTAVLCSAPAAVVEPSSVVRVPRQGILCKPGLEILVCASCSYCTLPQVYRYGRCRLRCWPCLPLPCWQTDSARTASIAALPVEKSKSSIISISCSCVICFRAGLTRSSRLMPLFAGEKPNGDPA